MHRQKHVTEQYCMHSFSQNNQNDSEAHQWMVVFMAMWFVTLISTSSSSWTAMVGPGNFPFTVRSGFLWHKRVTFVHPTYKKKHIIVHMNLFSWIIFLSCNFTQRWRSWLAYVKLETSSGRSRRRRESSKNYKQSKD